MQIYFFCINFHPWILASILWQLFLYFNDSHFPHSFIFINWTCYFRKSCHFSHLFSYLFILVGIHICLLFGYNPMLFIYFVTHAVPVLATGNIFQAGSYAPLILSHLSLFLTSFLSDAAGLYCVFSRKHSYFCKESCFIWEWNLETKI